MTKLLMSMAMLAAAFSASAQQYPTFFEYSHIDIDIASGFIQGSGLSEVQNALPSDVISAETYSFLSGPGQSATDDEIDNCGRGCATTYVTGQVQALDNDYSCTSYTSGYDDSGETGNTTFSDSPVATVHVPAAPAIYLDSINAIDPHNVYWNYSVNGYCPYSLNWELVNYLQIETGCPGHFIVDQSSYPGGSNTAQITGQMFGFTTPGPNCAVNVVNYSASDRYAGTTPDGNGSDIAPEIIPVDHVVAVIETYYQTCEEDYNSSRATSVFSATGSISTTRAAAGTNSTIYSIGENFNYPGATEGLGPETHYTMPAQGPQFQSRENDYNPPYWWLPTQPVSICNVLFLLLNSSNETYPANTQGCINLTVI